MDEELVRIMVRQNASMCFFDDLDVQARTKKAYPDLKVNGRQYYRSDVIPSMADDIKQEIVQQIGGGHFSITSDGWQKPSKFPALLSVTTHTVNSEFERLDNVLATIPMERDHTGDEIARLIEQCLQKNGLQMERLVAMVRDDASNMQKSCRLLEIQSFQFSAHFYHLVVTDALKSNADVSDVIFKVRKWVGGTHRSSLARLLTKFQIAEEIAERRIPMDVTTRWNSTYLMLMRFSENKNAMLKVEELLMDDSTSRKPPDVSQNDWNKLRGLASTLPSLNIEDFAIVKELCKVLCKVLKAFHVETCRLSADQSTASIYLPTVKRMLEHLRSMPIRNAAVADVKSSLVEGLQRRSSVVERNKLLKLSMLVDPRFAFDTDYLKEYEWDYLEEEFVQLLINGQEVVSVSDEVTDVGTQSEANLLNDSNSMDVDDIWTNKRKPVLGNQCELKATIKAELSHYRHNSDRPERSENIFAWWRKNKARFPLVAKGAKILFLFLTFSIAGLLYSNTLRNRMNATTAEMLILIKANLNKLKLAPTTVPDDEELQKHVLEGFRKC